MCETREHNFTTHNSLINQNGTKQLLCFWAGINRAGHKISISPHKHSKYKIPTWNTQNIWNIFSFKPKPDCSICWIHICALGQMLFGVGLVSLRGKVLWLQICVCSFLFLQNPLELGLLNRKYFCDCTQFKKIIRIVRINFV